jgi:hypothetical protein
VKSPNGVTAGQVALLGASIQAGQPFANQGDSTQRIFVPYMNLGMGLNTRKDTHALERSELAVLVNGWYLQAQIMGKRPGVTPLITGTGATGVSAPIGNIPAGIVSMIATRFGGTTWLVIQNLSGGIYYAPVVAAGSSFTWQQIGSITPGGIMRGAQMYDPQRSADAVFIVSGKDVPQYWLGPQTMLQTVDTTANHCPTKAGSVTQPITPSYVATLGNNSHLFYAGEPSAPSAVYVSDPFFPESFSTPLTQVNPMLGAYQPALIGNNDGVDGGNITGLQTLGSSMIVFKESAVYTMIETQLFGDIAFQVENISSTVGCLSPRSIVAMDGFLCFLAIDGIYATDGNTAQQISGNVPTFFDSTVLGQPALIANRTNAIAFRHGTRFIVFIDTGTGAPDTGVWFDFAVQGDNGLPANGQMNFSTAGALFTPMYLGGAVTLRGPRDDGNVAIAASNGDFVGKFGLGFADISFAQLTGAPTMSPILVTLRGKADFFEDVFGDDAPACLKNLDKIRLFVSIFQTQLPNASLTFTGNVITDIASEFPITALPAQLPVQSGPRWGTTSEGGTNEKWGTTGEGGTGAIWTAVPPIEGLYFDLPVLSPQTAWGKIIQMEFSEQSFFGWSILGYALQIGKTEVSD